MGLLDVNSVTDMCWNLNLLVFAHRGGHGSDCLHRTGRHGSLQTREHGLLLKHTVHQGKNYFSNTLYIKVKLTSQTPCASTKDLLLKHPVHQGKNNFSNTLYIKGRTTSQTPCTSRDELLYIKVEEH